MDQRIERLLSERKQHTAIEIGSSEASVLKTDAGFLKIAPREKLRRAAILQEYFAEKGLSAPLIAFDQDEKTDYLLVAEVGGRSGIEWLDRPEWLASQLGQAIRALHEINAADCPIQDVNEQALALYRCETGHDFFGDATILQKDALVHGDCCLPNVFFGENGFSGMIDLGEGGLGDRHFDLYWAMWSLNYNLKTDRYGDRFLDAYGREAVDSARLDCCARLSRCDE